MEQRALEELFRALHAAAVRYLVVGGLAVVAHSYTRFTADVDLALSFAEDNLARAVAALEALGFQPRVPVAFSTLLDAEQRRHWTSERAMVAFSVWSPAYPLTEVDIHLAPPLPDFDALDERAVTRRLGGGLPIRVIGRADLIALKRAAGRPKDLDDVRALLALAEGEPSDDRS